LDNPDPVERETISNPNPKKSKYPAELDSKIRILYITAGHQRLARISTGSDGTGLKPILYGAGLDRTAIFLKIGGSGLDRTEKIFDVFM